MKKIVVSIFASVLSIGLLQAQDTMYIMKFGNVVYQRPTNQIDSVIFYRPNTNTGTNPANLILVNIPAGTFTMGSPTSEVDHGIDETQHQVTLSAFRMSKYEITNTEYAAFLNTKSIDSNGLFAAGAFPTQVLIYASSGTYDLGLHYTGGQWVPVAGYGNYPVIDVTWYGATEYAAYAGGTLATEAQWEYACRGNTSTPFNTGACLSDAQANYYWAAPYNTCTNTNTTYPETTQAVGSYTANAYGLEDMHGNVWEWCSDWYGTYPTTAQTDPTGPSTGSDRVFRGGCWGGYAQYCRSAIRNSNSPATNDYTLGFRVVLAP
jgi:sulfatase modifying factor 1